MSKQGTLSFKNKKDVKKSQHCACYYCLCVYPAKEVTDFTGDQTAICPRCGIDSVLADATAPLPDSLTLLQYYEESFENAD